MKYKNHENDVDPESELGFLTIFGLNEKGYMN